MSFGSHISISSGIENAPLIAREIGAECFQVFTKPPGGGKFSNLGEEIIALFKKNLEKSKIKNFYIHAPYYINLASSDNRVYFGGIKAIRDDLEKGSLLGAKYVMTHIGSAKDLGEEESVIKTTKAFKKILNGYEGSTKLLIENSAGAGNIIGDSFEEIAKILSFVKNKNLTGICFDTAHAFESGYDLRSAESISNVFSQFDKILGIDKIKLFHSNDSMTELGSRKDRHADIGEGSIGLEAFREIICDARFQTLDMILETPGEVRKNLEVLKNLK